MLPGDGANDVSMIQVADVGVGISGPEGMQVTCLFENDPRIELGLDVHSYLVSAQAATSCSVTGMVNFINLAICLKVDQLGSAEIAEHLSKQ